MIYLKIDTRSSKAKALLSFIKDEPFVKIIEPTEIPNEKTLLSIKEKKEGKTKSFNNINELMKELKS